VFVLARLSGLSLFVGKDKSLPESGAFERCLTILSVKALLANIKFRLGYKCVKETNTLAYYGHW
jgi:hypothetical protein